MCFLYVFCADVSVHYYFVCWICVGVVSFGVSFFGFVYFCISVGVGFLRWIKLRLVPCFFVIKTIHNMVGFGCVLWVFCGRRFLCVENAVYKIDFICSV